jgi:DNA-binding transcriptional MerR regulator
MLISELAEKAGRHPETIRRLEKRGLISSRRDINGWRHYSPDVVDKVKKLYADSDQSSPEAT